MSSLLSLRPGVRALVLLSPLNFSGSFAFNSVFSCIMYSP
jgi:hypothetical protein